ncbi:MAG: hypothetical protein AMXMBFR81_19150 [Chthonomonas sp.]
MDVASLGAWLVGLAHVTLVLFVISSLDWRIGVVAPIRSRWSRLWPVLVVPFEMVLYTVVVRNGPDYRLLGDAIGVLVLTPVGWSVAFHRTVFRGLKANGLFVSNGGERVGRKMLMLFGLGLVGSILGAAAVYCVRTALGL